MTLLKENLSFFQMRIIIYKKIEDLENKSDSLKEKFKCLEEDHDILQNEIISFKEKPSILLEHENSLANYLTKENEALKKESNELNDIILCSQIVK